MGLLFKNDRSRPYSSLSRIKDSLVRCSRYPNCRHSSNKRNWFSRAADTYGHLIPGAVIAWVDRLELVQPKLLHNSRIPGAEPLVVLPRPPCGTSGIDQTTLGIRRTKVTTHNLCKRFASADRALVIPNPSSIGDKRYGKCG